MTSELLKRIREGRGLPGGARWGIGLAFGAALISGVAIYVNAFAVKQLPDAAVYTTLKNGVAGLILVGAVLATGAGRHVGDLSRRQWLTLVSVGVVGGSVPFVLFFSGLAMATAPNAAFIHKTLFIWVTLLAVPFLGERLGVAPIAALVVLFVGQALVLSPAGMGWGTGEWMILAATLLWTVETIVVKRLLASVPSGLVGACRLGIGLVILVGFLGATGKLGILGQLSAGQWAWALLTGMILAGYVATWFAALQRAPASIVTSVLVVGAVITGFLSTVSKGVLPAPEAIGGYVLIAASAAVLAAWSVRVSRSHGGAVPALAATGAARR